MIKCSPSDPPPNYEDDVKKPGDAFLRHNSNPTHREWKRHSYWSKIHSFLYDQNSGLCQYCASWSPRSSQLSSSHNHTSVDHYLPKSKHTSLAYEWSNYRLCRARLNNYKSDFEDVLDPFTISDDWFFLDFSSFLIKPSAGINSEVKKQVSDSISRLRLNSDNDYVNERISVIREYTLGRFNFELIREKYPFIAYQIKFQNFDTNFKDKYKEVFSN